MPDGSALSPLEAALGYRPALAPSGLWLTGEDRLRVTSFNAAAGVTLAIEGRVLLAGHGLRPFAERHVPATNRTATSTTFPIGEGWLLDLVVRASAGTPRRGQCFVIVELVRGSVNGAVQPLAVLVQGYVTDTQRRGWPGSPLELSTEGPGVLRSITGSDPAAGAEFSETCPANARWLLRSLQVALVTDATVASRLVHVTIDDGAAVVARAGNLNAHAASLTVNYTLGQFGANLSSSNTARSILSHGELWLMGGFRVNSLTDAIQAGDNYGAPQLLVEEWIEN